MNGGPIGSEYPGTPVVIMMAAFCSFLVGKSLLSAFRRRRDRTTGRSYGADVLVAIIAAQLLVMALWAIWIHR
jgi:hypothetical protein